MVDQPKFASTIEYLGYTEGGISKLKIRILGLKAMAFTHLVDNY
jgi:hypothetical protein